MPGDHQTTSAAELAALRKEYGARGLDENDVDPDPWVQWQRWYDDAVAAGIHEPNAMIVATVDGDGAPSSRTVLLKGVAPLRPDDGFSFFTNTASRKGRALAHESSCALLFPWHPLERQVRVEGMASPLAADVVQAYWATRPRGSQLGAWASPQSQVVSGREELDQAYRDVEARFDGQDVPVPPTWGGYLVRPASFEFWQGRRGRLHDRISYGRTSTGWDVTRLAP
ncbi:MAG: pyridoxamine 5'-phosphate oxidase [Propionibacteriales bacterium]|nr:pyridoxamine 5'-phosphate oxidase [Propionibacteriales bacterium]